MAPIPEGQARALGAGAKTGTRDGCLRKSSSKMYDTPNKVGLVKTVSIKGLLGSMARDIVTGALCAAVAPVAIDRSACGELQFIQSLGRSKAANQDLERVVSGILDKGRVLTNLSTEIVRLARQLAEGRLPPAVEDPSADERSAVELAAQLDSVDVTERLNACSGLGDLGQASLPHLRKVFSHLSDEDWSVRRAAQAALMGFCKYPDGANALVKRCGIVDLADEPEAFVRHAVCEILGVASCSGFESAQQAAAPHCDAVARCAAVDGDREVRRVACAALGRFGKAARVHKDTLLERLQDGDRVVALVARKALVQIGEEPEAHLAAIVESLEDNGFVVRAAACEALGELVAQKDGGWSGDNRYLLAAISLRLRDLDFFVRSAACEALGRSGAESASAAEDTVQALAESLADENVFVRRAACEALGRLGKASAPHASDIASRLEDESDWVRGAACQALARLAEVAPGVVAPFSPSFAKLLNDMEEATRADGSRFAVRVAALDALGALGQVAAAHTEVIAQLLQDDDLVVAVAARRTLERLQKSPKAKDAQAGSAFNRSKSMPSAQTGAARASAAASSLRFAAQTDEAVGGSNSTSQVSTPPVSQAMLNVNGNRAVGFLRSSSRTNKSGGSSPSGAKQQEGQQSPGSPNNGTRTASPGKGGFATDGAGRDIVVTLVAARGLRNADTGPFEGVSDPYCVCRLLGQPKSKFKTATEQDTLEPVWNHQGKLANCFAGDTIEFTVYDSDFLKSDDLLGQATLQITTEPMSFSGDLELRFEGQPAGLLRVKVREAVEFVPAAPRPTICAVRAPVDRAAPGDDDDRAGKHESTKLQGDKARTDVAAAAVAARPPPRSRVAGVAGAAAAARMPGAAQTPGPATPAAPAPGEGMQQDDLEDRPQFRTMKTMDVGLPRKPADTATKAINAGPAPRKMKKVGASDMKASMARTKSQGRKAQGAFETLEDGMEAVATISSSSVEEFRARRSACETLGRCGEAGAAHTDALVPLLQDEDVDIRGSAVEALGKIGQAVAAHHEAVGKLLHDLATFERSDGSTEIIQVAAIRTLAAMGQASASALKGLAEIADSGDPDTAMAALNALTMLSAARARAKQPNALSHSRTQDLTQSVLDITVPFLIDGKLGIRLKKNDLVISGFEVPEAEAFGWKVGDGIVTIQGKPVNTTEEFKQIFLVSKGSLPLTIGVVRGRAEVDGVLSSRISLTSCTMARTLTIA